jgi:hypothetical protein
LKLIACPHLVTGSFINQVYVTAPTQDAGYFQKNLTHTLLLVRGVLIGVRVKLQVLYFSIYL